MAIIYRLERKKILASQFHIIEMVKRVLLLGPDLYTQNSCLERTEQEEEQGVGDE